MICARGASSAGAAGNLAHTRCTHTRAAAVAVNGPDMAASAVSAILGDMTVRENSTYRVVEGEHAGRVGRCRRVVRSSFGREWCDVELVGGGMPRVRASDLEPLRVAGSVDAHRRLIAAGRR